MPKRIITSLYLVFYLSTLWAQDTTIYSQYVTLNTDISSYGDVEVIAIDSILLDAGFYYSSDGNDAFKADADIYSVDEPQGHSPYTSAGTDSLRGLNLNLPVGTINGNAGVSPSGGALYSIPIAVPQGNGGLEPRISVSYNSQSAYSGIMGKSWNISGLSSIVSVPRNYYYDDYKGSISSVDSLTRIIWDGQRLFGIDAKGLEADSFYTEVNSYSRIEKKTDSNGAYFKIKTPAGMTMIYGQSLDTKMHFNDSTEWTWMLEKVYDRDGNTIEYEYQSDTSKLQILLSKVKYGGDSSDPINEIQFHYSTSTYFNYEYLLDNLILKDKTLDSITISSYDTNLGTYAFTYQEQGRDLLLSEVYQYDKDRNFFNPTKIQWNIPEFSLTPSRRNASIYSGPYCNYYVGDYNGDGFSDVATVDLNYFSGIYKYYIYYGSTSGLPSTYNTSGDLPRSFTYEFWDTMINVVDTAWNISCNSSYDIPDISYVISGDFDGDGLDELMVKIMEWDDFASYLPANLNLSIEDTIWTSTGFNGFVDKLRTDTSYKAKIQYPLYQFDFSDIDYGIGKFVHFDEAENAQRRITTIRLGVDVDTLPYASQYPDIVGMGFSSFLDDGKIMYYDYASDTTTAVCNSPGFHMKVDLNGDNCQDLIREDSGLIIFSINNAESNLFTFPDPVEGEILGTIDLNGDGARAFAYLEPEEFAYTYYSEYWDDYCTSGCGFGDYPMDPATWSSFLSDSGYTSEYNSYIQSDSNRTNDISCIESFLTTSYDSVSVGRKFIIDHLPGHGPKIDFGYDFFEIDSEDFLTMGIDINADGREELLIFGDNTLKKIVYGFSPVYTAGRISSFSYSEFLIDTIPNENPDLYELVGMGGTTRVGDFNGDGIIELLTPTANSVYSFSSNNISSQTVSDIVNGVGNTNRFNYSTLTDSSVYTMGSGAKYPVIDFTAPMQVVSSVSTDNGIAGSDSIIYNYASGKIHVAGKGFLGFMENSMESVNSNSRAISLGAYDTTFFYPYSTAQYTLINGDTISKSSSNTRLDNVDSSFAKIFNVVADTLTGKDYLNNVISQSTLTYNNLDQVSSKKTEIGNTATLTESYSYTTGNWYFPYLIDTVRSSISRGDSIIRDTTEFQYNSLGHIIHVKQFAGTNKELNTSVNNYTLTGVPLSYSKSGKWGQRLTNDSITMDISLSSFDRFVTSSGGELDHIVRFNYDTISGLLNSQTGANGLSQSYEYGPFGMLQKQVLPGSMQIVSKIFWAEGHPDAPEGSLFYSWSQSSGMNESYTFFDAMGRSLRKVSFGFNNEKIFSDQQYDNLGRLSKESLPYETTDSPLWTTYSYDSYNRIDEILSPDTLLTEYAYSALWQSTTVSKGASSRTTEVSYNELGETIQSKDAMGNIVYYMYNPDGSLKETYTSVCPSIRTKIYYDNQGYRTMLIDPDADTIRSNYDSFGNLLWEINAKGDTTSYEYDKLSRLTSSTDSRGEKNYVYFTDTSQVYFGMIDSIYNPSESLSEVYTYDTIYGRLISSTRRIPDKTFTDIYSYDWFGRPITRTYPSGFELEYSYTDGGHLEEIYGEGTTIWSCNAVNVLGQVTSYSQGDYSTALDIDPFGKLTEITTGSIFNMKYGFNELGMLTSRSDEITNQKEVFSYDNLNRLREIDYYLNGSHVNAGDLDLTYGNDGNILSKSDISEEIEYGENGAGPHALSSIYLPEVDFKPPPQVIAYTDFNKVSTLQDTVGQDTTLTLTFTYGLNNQRIKTVLSRNNTVEQIKYFNGDYEEDSTSTGTKKYHYINSPTGLIGIFVIEGSADTLYHVLSDHLGSLNGVINAETDSISYFSYGAWGTPRDPDDWTSGFDGELFAGRGYTGHEHLTEFSLINMNGRVYDPQVARFLSPDPFVQFPGVADGYNRYSYVMNNPMMFVDPSGYLTQDQYDKIIAKLLNMPSYSSWSPGSGFTYYIDLSGVSRVSQYMEQSGDAGGSAGGSWLYYQTSNTTRGAFSFDHGMWKFPRLTSPSNKWFAIWVPDFTEINLNPWAVDNNVQSEDEKGRRYPGGSDGGGGAGPTNNNSATNGGVNKALAFFLRNSPILPNGKGNPFRRAEAIMMDVGANIGGSETDGGVVIVLAGPDVGKIRLYGELAGGGGTDGGINGEITRIDYYGNIDQFSLTSLEGFREKYYLSISPFSEGPSVGIGFTSAFDLNGGRIIGYTKQVGIGGGIIPFLNGGYNQGNVKIR